MTSNSRRQFLGLGAATAMVVAGRSVPAQSRDRQVTSATLPKLRSDADIEQALPALSNWNRWGADDRLGTLNFITAAHRARAAAEVQSGVSVSLARETPIAAVERGEHVVDVRTMGSRDYLAMVFHGFEMTHLDALGHVFADEVRMYNGLPRSNVTADGVSELGAELLAATGIVGRGVLLDMPAVMGGTLAPGTAVFPDDLEAAEERQDVRVGQGDLLLVRTGAGRDNTRQARAGLHPDCLAWLHAREVALIGGDGDSDVAPLEGFERWGSAFHTVAIPYMGMPLIDNAELDELSRECAKQGRWSFLMTVAPLRIAGLTGSPVNPIALL